MYVIGFSYQPHSVMYCVFKQTIAVFCDFSFNEVTKVLGEYNIVNSCKNIILKLKYNICRPFSEMIGTLSYADRRISMVFWGDGIA